MIKLKKSVGIPEDSIIRNMICDTLIQSETSEERKRRHEALVKIKDILRGLTIDDILLLTRVLDDTAFYSFKKGNSQYPKLLELVQKAKEGMQDEAEEELDYVA